MSDIKRQPDLRGDNISREELIGNNISIQNNHDWINGLLGKIVRTDLVKVISSLSDFFVIHNNLKIIYVSPEVEKHTDYKQEELLGENIFNLTSSDSHSALAKSVNRKTDEAVELYCYLKDRRKVCISTRILGYDEENPGLMISAITLVTKRKEFEYRYKTILGLAQDGYLVIDQNGIIVETNETSCRVLGYGEDELIGQNLKKFVVEDNSYSLEIVAGRIIRDGWTRLEDRKRCKDGSIIETEVNVLFSALDGGKFISFFRDITRRKRHIQEIEKKNIALEELLNNVENEKSKAAEQMQRNVDLMVKPILRRLAERLNREDRTMVDSLTKNLSNIMAPFIKRLEGMHPDLTPREIEICNMIKNGQSSKDIALSLNTSLHTVFTQRKNIRNKLGLTGDKANISSYLRTFK